MRTKQNLQAQANLAARILDQIAAGNCTHDEIQDLAKQLAELVLDLNTMVHDGHKLPSVWPLPKDDGKGCKP